MHFINRLSELTPQFQAIVCDIWGVVHNGEWAFPAAAKALEDARANGLAVVLVTNAPRRSGKIVEQMSGLGVPSAAYDRVVTSGDATRGRSRRARAAFSTLAKTLSKPSMRASVSSFAKSEKPTPSSAPGSSTTKKKRLPIIWNF